MPRYKLTIEYLGTPYAGWQRQPGQKTVQEEIEKAIHAFCGETAELICAGRTDAGVHATGQVAHVDILKEETSFTVGEAINFHLKGEPIVIRQVEPVGDDFHARFSATQRRYVYRLLNRRPPPCHERGRVWHVKVPLNEKAMHDAAQLLLGQHDFSAFRARDCQAKSPVKTLDEIAVIREGDEVRIEVAARSFLYNQVRIMTGTLAAIGRGDADASLITDALSGKKRELAGATAPAEGLYFKEVRY